ncbi:apoptosis regulatory protein Siva-like [Danaus plexippus]|uniref:apoptosis regulatory protein Siva-like n=1 Tax=Danaus plexippus TaxID=13037 RepID=UPI002AB1FB20|nr:apoptosis regulatory protein Siva-like [Danaus plexippus]XP_061383149.1 apoptosis regulatory protein Siva-like [Danaus plexippus]XP_061383150.1 apoptosis regulatory protein Siva-like [Danaus plexippus]
MAKRANPYSEDFIQQSKIFVNLKQFNNNEDRLKKVYEKTLQMLFEGAKKSQNNNNNNSIHEINGIAVDRKNKMKQLFIDKNGSLSHSGTLVGPDVCKPCQCGDVSLLCCQYCEQALCNLCTRSCALCQHNYCTKCSLVGSEGVEVCVSCYS